MEEITLKKTNALGRSIKNVSNWGIPQLGGGGGGVKNWSKLPTDTTKKLASWGRGVSKIRKKLPTSFIDGPSKK